MELKVFTLNCWGLAVVSKNRKDRMQAIAEVLATGPYDVVCLQEVWIDSDFNLIKDKASGNLPYSHYFYSGVTGSGVCILSRHPIEEVFFHQWPVNGYIHKVHHGDWFGGKGVGCCRLKVNNYIINVYSAHLHAEYDRECDDYQCHRVLQAFDTAQFIQLTAGNADISILAGDLNTEPGDIAYRLMLSVPGFTDSFIEAGDEVSNISGTNENPSNSYTPSTLVKDLIPGKRIDYIMYHAGANVDIKLKSYQLPLPDKVPHQNFSYSDHEAVFASLFINRAPNEKNRYNAELKRTVLEESIAICDDALRNLCNSKKIYWFFTFVLFMILVAALCTSAPSGFAVVYHILKVVITIFMFFNMIMATIWNKIERHAVVAGKLAMGVTLRQYKSEKDQ